MTITGEQIGLIAALTAIQSAQNDLAAQMAAQQTLLTGLVSCVIICIALLAFMAVTHR